MSDLAQLEQSILAAVEAAADETALEAVRVAALGKKGSVSALLGDARQDDAGGAQGAGPADQRAEGARHRGARRPPPGAEGRSARPAAQHGDGRRHAAAARQPGRAGPHPSDQPGDRRVDGDLRRHGLCDRRRSGHRDRRLQFHPAEFPGRACRARHARHVLLLRRRRTARACCCAPTPRRCRCAPC